MSTHSHGSDRPSVRRRKLSGDSTGSGGGSIRRNRASLEKSPLPTPIDDDNDNHHHHLLHHRERRLSGGSTRSAGGSIRKKRATLEQSPLPTPIDNDDNDHRPPYHHTPKPDDPTSTNRSLGNGTSFKISTSPSAKVAVTSPSNHSPSTVKQPPLTKSSSVSSNSSVRPTNVSSPLSNFYSWITAYFMSPFQPNDKVRGQSLSVLRMCNELGLTKSDVDHLWHYFKKADITGNGSLSVTELCLQRNEVQNDYFGQLLFSVFDYDGNGEITFEEFCLCIWNAMTLDHAELPLFAFRIYDQNNSGTLSEDEMITMLKTVCGSNERTIDHAMHYFKENDRNHDGIIDCQEFEKMAKHVQLITFPAIQLLKEFRKNVLGEHVWHEKTKIRHDKFPGLYLPVRPYTLFLC